MKLDIGCGRKWPEGWEGLDSHDFGQKYIMDLENPDFTVLVDDGEVEAIRMWNTLEHLTKPAAIRVLNECHRVLALNGTMEIVTPDATKGMDFAMSDPTHVTLWTPGTFTGYICGGRPRNADYGIKKWKLLSLEYDLPTESRAMHILMSPNKL